MPGRLWQSTLKSWIAGKRLYRYELIFFILTKSIRYPSKPSPGTRKPDGVPRKSPSGDPLFVSNIDSDDEGDSNEGDLIGGEGDSPNNLEVHIPGCGDKYTREKSKNDSTGESTDDSTDESEDDLPKTPIRVEPSQ